MAEERLVRYVENPPARFDPSRRAYVVGGRRVRGIHRFIRKEYVHPAWRPPVSRNDRRSSRRIGKSVDRAFDRMLEGSGCSGKYGKTATECLRRQGLRLLASQVPVSLPGIRCATEADFVTESSCGTGLAVWEVKTGGRGQERAAQHFKPPLEGVRCTQRNQWFLQLLYAAVGLLRAGLPVRECYVLHVWQTRKGQMRSKVMPLPRWAWDYAQNAYARAK